MHLRMSMLHLRHNDSSLFVLLLVFKKKVKEKENISLSVPHSNNLFFKASSFLSLFGEV